MDDSYLRSRLEEFTRRRRGEHSALLDLAGISKRHARAFRYGERTLSPRMREKLEKALALVDSGQIKFEKHKDVSGRTGRHLCGVHKTYAVHVEKPVERSVPLGYANKYFADLRAKSNGRPHLSLQTLPARSRLYGR